MIKMACVKMQRPDSTGVTLRIPDGRVGVVGFNVPYGPMEDDRGRITNVIIPDSAEWIGRSAFQDCTALEEVTIPNKVKTIGVAAFRGCTELKKVTIGDSVETIESDAFHGCTVLEEVTIPNSVKTFGRHAFSYCTALKKVTIGDSVKTIGDVAFRFTALEEVTIGESVETIGGYAFDGTALTKVTIPNSVKTIGLSAFGDCRKLAEVTIGDSVETIESCAFLRTALTTVTINASTIGEYAFFDCLALKKVTLGDSVKTIGFAAFEGPERRDRPVKPVVTIRSSTRSTGGAFHTLGINAFMDCDVNVLEFYPYISTFSNAFDPVTHDRYDKLLTLMLAYSAKTVPELLAKLREQGIVDLLNYLKLAGILREDHDIRLRFRTYIPGGGASSGSGGASSGSGGGKRTKRFHVRF